MICMLSRNWIGLVLVWTIMDELKQFLTHLQFVK